MLEPVAIYAIVSVVAAMRGHKSPLFGASGIVLYFILQFPALVVFREFSKHLQVAFAALAAVAILCGILLSMPAFNLRTEPKISSFPYGALGSVCVVLAILVGGIALFFAITMDRVFITFAMLDALLISGALSCSRLHKQQSTAPASRVLLNDPRPPVLFLRSFRHDDLRKGGMGRGIVRFFSRSVGKSFDEILAPAMNKIGPFIALGNPEDFLPCLGSSKVYQRDDAWQETLISFLRPNQAGREGLVILLEGDSPGLEWEMAQVRDRCWPRSIYLMTPTAPFRRASWHSFAKLLQQAGFKIPNSDIGPGAVVGYDESLEPVVLCQNVKNAEESATAIMEWKWFKKA
jgi:hypothetical protein